MKMNKIPSFTCDADVFLSSALNTCRP